MAIPEYQLETWSNQGATVSAQQTHESVRAALNAASSPIRERDVEIYLQGSYRNATNIYGDSDVDIVVQLNESFIYDDQHLSSASQATLRQTIPPAVYNWSEYRRDVISALQAWYGAAAVDLSGNKSIKIPAASGRLNADVVPCLQFRRINALTLANTYTHTPGICFYTALGNREVVNYPKLHIANGQDKNGAARTRGAYKPSLRMFKNIRSRLADLGKFRRDQVPSYFVECLFYNVPDAYFSGNRQQAFCDVIRWLNDNLNAQFVCQNGMVPLFGPTPEQWNLTDARLFVNCAIDFWNDW